MAAITASPPIERSAATLLALALAGALAAVHLFGQRLRALDVAPRSSLLSAAGGASVSYVFVHLLPELEHARRTVERGGSLLTAFTEHHVYLVALTGFIVFYGLERFACLHGHGDRSDTGGGETGQGVFWVHVGSFAGYNGLVGYLLVHREEAGIANLLFFAVAMGLHLLVNDHGLREHHRDIYRRVGRWVLAAAMVGGAIVGAAVDLRPVALWTLFAFLAGAVILNSIKEELPEERESRFRAFAGGAAMYAALLVLA